jgi:nicotinic acid mononucleotide adenylyltransferase
VIVAARDDHDGVADALLELVPGAAARIDRVPMSSLTVASTELRARVREGRSTLGLVPEATRAVVDELGLYRA